MQWYVIRFLAAAAAAAAVVGSSNAFYTKQLVIHSFPQTLRPYFSGRRACVVSGLNDFFVGSFARLRRS